MKSSASIIAIALVAASAPESAHAFSSFTGSQLNPNVQNSGSSSITMEYIPSGMSKEQWQKMKQAEKNKNKGKNLGQTGITTFQSRSFTDWQKSGGKNLFPVDPTKVKDASEIPYMQRAGGKADNSDLNSNKKSAFGGMFGKKKAAAAAKPTPAPEPKKTNWWTL